MHLPGVVLGPDCKWSTQMDLKPFNYGDPAVVVDPNSFNPASAQRLLEIGYVTYLGSNQTARVSQKFKKLPDATKADKAAALAAFRAEALERIANGTMGERMGSSGTSKTDKAIAAEIAKLARASVLAALHKQNISAPRKSTDTIQFGDGTFTMAQLVEKAANGKNAERFRAEASATVNARKSNAPGSLSELFD